MKIFKTLPLFVSLLAAVSVSPLHSQDPNPTRHNATCTPVEVAVFENRIHVKCTNVQKTGSSGGIVFFAVSTSSSANTARFLSIFDSALSENRKLTLFYDDFEIAGQNFGCLIENCRVAHGAVLGPRQ